MGIWNQLQRFIRTGEESREEPTMKYLIAGLGNMGAEYDNTRHNIGFEVVDHLAHRFEVSYAHEHLGDLAEFRHKSRTFILLKPSTYMNRSGKAVRYWMQKKKVKPEKFLVIVDDLAIDLGKIRLRGKGSDGGHNGLRDIIQVLGSTRFARLKVGIGDDYHSGQQVDYVLGKWTEKERNTVDEVIKKAADCALSFGTIGLSHTMNQFN